MSQPLSNFGPITYSEHRFAALTSVDSEVKARLFMEQQHGTPGYVGASIENTLQTSIGYVTYVTVARQFRLTADQSRTIGRDIDPAPLNPAEQAEAVDRLVDAAPGTVESLMGWLAVCRALFPNARLSPEPA